MIAITTSNSINVKPRSCFRPIRALWVFITKIGTPEHLAPAMQDAPDHKPQTALCNKRRKRNSPLVIGRAPATVPAITKTFLDYANRESGAPQNDGGVHAH